MALSIGATARAVMMAATLSAVTLDGAAAQTAGAAATKYPLKFGKLEVARGRNPNVEYCLIRGFRAQPPGASKDEPLGIEYQVVFDEEMRAYSRAEISVSAPKSSFTNAQKQPVDVRIDLDGTTHDMPSGDVHQAVVTFLNFRFPVEFLNKIAAAKVMKIYTLDAKTKAPTLFATADLQGDRAAFAEHGKCADSLPEIPSEIPGGWLLDRDDHSCLIANKSGEYGVVLTAKVGPKNEATAGLVFFEKQNPTVFNKPVVSIDGKEIEFEYEGRQEGTIYQHLFAFAEKDLDRLQQGSELEISEDGDPKIGGENLYPAIALKFLKKCAATLKKAS